MNKLNDLIPNLRTDTKALSTYLTLLFSLFQLVPDAVSQQSLRYDALEIQRFSAEEGLSSNSINCLLKDSHGFLWIGTVGGLNRFDGSSFRTYLADAEDPDAISGNSISVLFEENETDLWVGTYQYGLNKYNRRDDTFINHRHRPDDTTSISDDAVTSLVGDSEVMWVGTYWGLNKMKLDEERFEQILRERDAENQINTLLLTDSLLLVGSAGGLWAVDVESGVPLTEALWESTTEINSIYLDDFGQIWLGTQNGIVVLDTSLRVKNHFTSRNQSGLLTSNIVREILKDRFGNLWFTTDNGGISVYLTKEEKFVKVGSVTESGFASLAFNCLLDDGKRIWAGSYDRGLYSVDANGDPFPLFRDQKIGDNENWSILDVAVYDDGLWVGTDGEGLYAFNSDQLTLERADLYNRQFPQSVVKKLHSTKEGILWIGTYADGLKRWDTESERINSFHFDPTDTTSLVNDNVWAMLEDVYGTLWIGTLDGLCYLNSDGKTFTRIPELEYDSTTYSSGVTYTIFEDSDSLLWFGTADGINRYVGFTDSFINYHTRNSKLDGDLVTAIEESKDGTLFFISDGGVNYLRKTEKFSKYPRFERLPIPKFLRTKLLGAAFDSEGDLWLTSTDGLHEFRFADSTIFTYDKGDGLEVVNFNYDAIGVNPDGDMFFGGYKGFFAIDSIVTASVVHQPQTSPVVITDFMLFHQSVEDVSELGSRSRSIVYSDTLLLNYDQNFLTFRYSALNFNPDASLQYQHRMLGLSEDWSNVGDEQLAHFTDLGPGSYSFEVQVVDPKTGQFGPVSSVFISIDPPFWGTWWFRSGSVFMIIMIAVVIIYLRISANRKARIALEEKVATRTLALKEEVDKRRLIQQDLIVAKDEALASAKSKSLFLSIMSHEIRTPLNAVIGLSNLATQESNVKKLSETIELIDFSARNLLSIVNDILDWSQLESGNVMLDSEIVDAKELFRKLSDTWSILAKDKGLDFVVDIDQELPRWLSIDELRFVQIINNLLNNAMKFTSVGSVKLRANVLSKASDSVNCEFSIEDTGVGISEEEQKQIFKLYHQANPSTSKRFGGTGLGLSISKVLVKLMGSELQLSSKKGQGTKFYFNLSLDYSEQHDVKAESKVDNSTIIGKSILVVDDNIMNVVVAEQILEKWGAKPTRALSGEQALEAVTTDTFDLILMDLYMPGKDGFETAREIRKLGAESLPIIALTASDLTKERHNVFNSGMNEVLFKPIEIDSLHKILLKYL